jgi:hypothetical protein
LSQKNNCNNLSLFEINSRIQIKRWRRI